MPPKARPDQALLRRWVDTWHRAEVELEEIRRAELIATDTREAVRQIFGDLAPERPQMAAPTSGLVEQQAWFGKLAHRAR